MPSDNLAICREVLENAYRHKLSLEFGSSIAEVGKSNLPVWRIVSIDDLVSDPEGQSASRAGLLLDPVIGLLLYILPFHSETNLRKQVVRTLALRSQLAIERNYTGQFLDSSDSRGAWRIVVYWLVDPGAKDKWVEQIMDVRRETAFSEEISFDAIFLSDTPVKDQVEDYGFPQLLLTTREVLNKQRLEEMDIWLSANKLVEQTLSGFPALFRKQEQCGYANDVLQAMREFRTRSSVVIEDRAPDTPQTLRSIHIRDFRNLRDVRCDFGPQTVGACVLHGPNGTGKSSLCEAISIALFQSSLRYKWFADRTRETDVTVTDRANEYLEKYLTTIGTQQPGPQIKLNEQSFLRPQLVPAGGTEQADLAMCGTVLTQDASLEFARMRAHELGARILRGYSELAEHIQTYTDGRVNQVSIERQDFLRGLGLSAAITKIDTAYDRIARQELDTSLPPFPQTIVAWLESVGKFLANESSTLPQRWRAWGDENSRNNLAHDIAKSIDNEEGLTGHIRQWLLHFNELVAGSSEFTKRLEARIEPIHHDFENAAERIRVWGEWIERRMQHPQSSGSREAEELTKKLLELQSRHKQVFENGRSAADHLDHLTQVEAYVRENWSRQHIDTCPTCGANHAQDGGIVKVVEILHTKTAADREQLRKEYGELKIQIDQIQKRLADLGQAQCPLSSDEQSNIEAALQWLLPAGMRVADWIGIQTQRLSLLDSIAALRQIPTIPSNRNAEIEAERVAQRVIGKFREAAKIFDAPSNWKPVKDELTKILSDIVNEHLPNTLEKLWCEIAINLTSAPWLLPERPRFDVAVRRGEQKSTIRVQGRLARYILNQAEIHTLGLAWFFTRYLTRGRFFHACLVMDDAAHELDQTTYRDLCRLWETILRLHRVYNRPLKLIIMLNQESRALEAARATGGILSILGWSREQKGALSTISVIGEGFYAPQPIMLFGNTGT